MDCWLEGVAEAMSARKELTNFFWTGLLPSFTGGLQFSNWHAVNVLHLYIWLGLFVVPLSVSFVSVGSKATT